MDLLGPKCRTEFAVHALWLAAWSLSTTGPFCLVVDPALFVFKLIWLRKGVACSSKLGNRLDPLSRGSSHHGPFLKWLIAIVFPGFLDRFFVAERYAVHELIVPTGAGSKCTVLYTLRDIGIERKWEKEVQVVIYQEWVGSLQGNACIWISPVPCDPPVGFHNFFPGVTFCRAATMLLY